jgi:hypothetical protein
MGLGIRDVAAIIACARVCFMSSRFYMNRKNVTVVRQGSRIKHLWILLPATNVNSYIAQPPINNRRH